MKTTTFFLKPTVSKTKQAILAALFTLLFFLGANPVKAQFYLVEDFSTTAQQKFYGFSRVGLPDVSGNPINTDQRNWYVNGVNNGRGYLFFASSINSDDSDKDWLNEGQIYLRGSGNNTVGWGLGFDKLNLLTDDENPVGQNLKSLSVTFGGSKIGTDEIDLDALNNQGSSSWNKYSDLQFDAYDETKHGYSVQIDKYAADDNSKTNSPHYYGQGVWHTYTFTAENSPNTFPNVQKIHFFSDSRGTVNSKPSSGGATTYEMGTPLVIRHIIFEYETKPDWAPAKTAQTIAFSSVSGQVGGSITATASSALPVAYIIEDESITKEENGKLVLLKVGTTKVKAVVAGNATYDGWVKEETITVSEAAIAVTGVTLDKGELSLVVGAEATLTATVAPEDATDKTVTWSSSAPAVAKVEVDENGVATVTALAAGTAEIIAKAGGKEGKCVVTVTAPVDYSWLLAPAIAVEGNTAKVVGSDADNFTKFYVNDTPTDGNSANISTATGEITLKATNADGTTVIKLKINKQ
ncbi:MAG: Ig domain-containing protein [Mangrovibacterium sp.]